MQGRSLTIGMFISSILLLAVGGCFVSEVAISSDKPVTVDRRFVGDWTQQNDVQPARLIIRNWDDCEYYVEYHEADEHAPLRMRGFLVDVNGSSFAHLRKLTDDGSLETSYLIMKAALQDDRLTLQNLNETFFEGKTVATGEQLRNLISANLNNKEMYTEGPAVFARHPASTQPN